MIFCTIAAASAALDLGIKQYVLDNVTEGEDRELAGGRLVLRRVYNRGAAFNLLEKSPLSVTTLSAWPGAVLLVRHVFIMRKTRPTAQKTGMTLPTGGDLSHLFDRVIRGKVVARLALTTRG